MNDFVEIVKSRSFPGVLIFGTDNKLLFINGGALKLLPNVEKIPSEILDLCIRVREEGNDQGNVLYGNCFLTIKEGAVCSARAIPLKACKEDSEKNHVMILLEGVTGRHRIDFIRAAKTFRLTKRELEVLKLLCDGCSNRNIAERLFVCEYTIKDHVKKIMGKMEVHSRSEIISALI